MTTATKTAIVHLRNSENHLAQHKMIFSEFKRLIVKAGRRGGKTVGAAIRAVRLFRRGHRVLYAAPTSEQTDKFWYEVKRALREPIDAGAYKCNETEQYVEKEGTENRIKAKTAWNANTLRGDFADLLILDEFQFMNEDAWDEVGAPMLLDNNGDAVFIFTPPSLKSQGASKARDPRHASKMFKKAQSDKTGLWETIHFASHENPFISQDALQIITQDMSLDSYRREILAEDDEIEISWLVHSKFNESLCKIKRFDIPKNWDIYSGHDFGSANPAAVFLVQVKLPLPPGAPAHMRYNDLVLWREYAPGAGFSTVQHVARFKEMTAGYVVRRSRGGNLNSEDEIRQGYTSAGWLILPPALEKKNSQIDRMINLEETNKIYIFEDMWQTLGQMANCLWKLKDGVVTNEIDNEQVYHCLSAMRYICSDADFRPETVNRGAQSRTTISDRRSAEGGLPRSVMSRR